MSAAAYLGGLVRVLLVYVIFVQLISALGMPLLMSTQSEGVVDVFTGLKWSQVAAIILIAFPVWSLFRRRINDIRPDIREKLSSWAFGFPIFLIGLLVFMVLNAAGYDTFFDDAELARIRFWFVVMLFGVAFLPGGDVVPEKAKPSKPQPDMFQTATQKANREALAAQIANKPAGRHLPAAHSDRPKPAAAPNFPPVIVRTRKLPQDGRVKPGWFS